MLVRITPFAAPRRGTTLAVVTVLLVALVGMVAFAVDIGFIATKRTSLQRTADAAALAAVAKLAPTPGRAADQNAARDEARAFVTHNESLTVLDADVLFGRYDPRVTVGSVFTTSYGALTPNAVRVTLRRDRHANGPLNLFFAPVIGRQTADVRATALATMELARGILPEAELLPYVVHRDYFQSALGSPLPGVDTSYITDSYVTRPGQAPLPGADGVKELALFTSTQKRPGNFGSVDIGSNANETPDLVRQILSGASAADFAHPDFAAKVTDGALYAPNTFTGDPGISGGVEKAFQSIIGQRRIIPLYSEVVMNGNSAAYTITEFAGVTVVAVDLKGNPKKIIVQPTAFFTNKVTASPGGGTSIPINGVYTPPRLVIVP